VRPNLCPPCIFRVLTTGPGYFIQEDIERLVRDLQAAKPEDQESVKSRYREASAAREPVRFDPPRIPQPTLTDDVSQFRAQMKEWEYLERFHQENVRKDTRSARVDQ